VPRSTFVLAICVYSVIPILSFDSRRIGRADGDKLAQNAVACVSVTGGDGIGEGAFWAARGTDISCKGWQQGRRTSTTAPLKITRDGAPISPIGPNPTKCEERFLDCAGRRFRRSENGRKSRPAPLGMTPRGTGLAGEVFAKVSPSGVDAFYERDLLCAAPSF